MAYQQLQIKDIFIGSIDAKDDFNNNKNEFIENFIVPPNFHIDDFTNGNKYLIEGYKGTGKTALLNYLRNTVSDDNTVSSVILFKSDFNVYDKEKLDKLASNIIQVDHESFKGERDFEYIWRWIFLAKIVDFNTETDYGIFKNDKNWIKFESVMSSLSNKGAKKKKLIDFFHGFKGEYKVSIPNTDVVYSLGLELLFEENTDNEFDFSLVLEKAMNLFENLNRTNKNVYIFLDELETYYYDEITLKRDLRLIRDLIFTVKYFNEKLFFNSHNNKMKFICAIRTEVIGSIQKNIVSKELNKVIYSHRKELKWNYPNLRDIKHPIIQIWINRIINAEKKYGGINLTSKKVMNTWFPKKVHKEDIVPYILHNTWNKPRDIIRFMQCAVNTCPNKLSYDENVFNEIRKEYSKESWKEISEELNAKYNPSQIEQIKSYLLSFTNRFTFDQAKERATKISNDYNDSFINDNIIQILKDLYRVGCIGNITLDLRYHRWQHKGDEDLLLNDSRHLIQVHNALRNELSLYYVHLGLDKDVSIGEEVDFIIERANKSFVYGKIKGSYFEGSISITNMKFDYYVEDLRDEITIGHVIRARITDNDPKYGYQLEFISEKLNEEDIHNGMSYEQKLRLLKDRYSR